MPVAAGVACEVACEVAVAAEGAVACAVAVDWALVELGWIDGVPVAPTAAPGADVEVGEPLELDAQALINTIASTTTMEKNNFDFIHTSYLKIICSSIAKTGFKKTALASNHWTKAVRLFQPA